MSGNLSLIILLIAECTFAVLFVRALLGYLRRRDPLQRDITWFFAPLTAFMSSGPSLVLCLEAPDAIKKWRDLMGATDPAKAEPGTLRKEFGASIDNNATHGSDAPDTAAFELAYFFRGMELR